MSRLDLGSTLPEFQANTLRGEQILSEELRGRPLLINFFRYAACPVCNETLAEFRVRHGDLAEQGVRVISIFHSPVERLLRYLDPTKLPFCVLADPEFKLYEQFGVEKTISMWLHPKSTMATLKSIAGPIKPSPFTADGTLHMRPANFLFDSQGRLAEAHYGEHLADSWSVNEALSKARRLRLRGSASAPSGQFGFATG